MRLFYQLFCKEARKKRNFHYFLAHFFGKIGKTAPNALFFCTETEEGLEKKGNIWYDGDKKSLKGDTAMKTIRRMVGVVLLLLVCACPVLASNGTEVSGILSEDTTWEAARGPYYVTDNLLVDSDVTLTIEAGTTVMAAKDKYIQVRGSIICNGTYDAPITLTSDDQDYKWKGITISELGNSTLPRTNTFAFCNISNASTAILGEKGTIQITNSTFDNCGRALHSDSTSSVFPASFEVDQCTFTNHDTAIYVTGNLDIQNSTIDRCTTGIYAWNDPLTCEATLIENCSIGIDLGYCKNATIDRCTFRNKVGIKWHPLSSGAKLDIQNSNFYDSTYYIKRTNAYGTVTAANNYWDCNDIPSKLYDFYDDFNLGKITYEPYLTAPYGSNLVNADHPSGSYPGAISVALSVSNGGAIYYTLDGSNPAENGIRYESPIPVAEDATLSCVSCANGSFSDVTSYTYTFVAPISDYTIQELYVSDLNGDRIGSGDVIPQSGKFFVNASVVKNKSTAEKGYLVIASYTKDGALLDYNIMSGTYFLNQEITFLATLHNQNGEIGSVKAFVWNSLTELKPLSNALSITAIEPL